MAGGDLFNRLYYLSNDLRMLRDMWAAMARVYQGSTVLAASSCQMASMASWPAQVQVWQSCSRSFQIQAAPCTAHANAKTCFPDCIQLCILQTTFHILVACCCICKVAIMLFARASYKLNASVCLMTGPTPRMTIVSLHRCVNTTEVHPKEALLAPAAALCTLWQIPRQREAASLLMRLMRMLVSSAWTSWPA